MQLIILYLLSITKLNIYFIGKKSKKTKWIPANVTNFIADTAVIPATNNWADSVDEERE